MATTPVAEPEIAPTGERPLDLAETSDLELARLVTWETAEQQEALDRFAWQMLQGAQNLRRWFWTVVLVALAVLVVGLLAPSP